MADKRDLTPEEEAALARAAAEKARAEREARVKRDLEVNGLRGVNRQTILATAGRRHVLTVHCEIEFADREDAREAQRQIGALRPLRLQGLRK